MKPAKIVGIQYAALPFRIEAGRVRILLITSRDTRRWIIPKGWPIDGLPPREAAAQEAAEEAGIFGHVEPNPIGSYRYEKQLKRESTAVQVIVFPFCVEDQAPAWKEQGQRDQAWYDPHGAARRVAEPSLKRLILDFAAARAPSFLARQLRRYRAWRFGPAAVS
jgi:8-oxo-dGTP pyrophosphatase MutT (NUDIX family)